MTASPRAPACLHACTFRTKSYIYDFINIFSFQREQSNRERKFYRHDGIAVRILHRPPVAPSSSRAGYRFFRPCPPHARSGSDCATTTCCSKTAPAKDPPEAAGNLQRPYPAAPTHRHLLRAGREDITWCSSTPNPKTARCIPRACGSRPARQQTLHPEHPPAQAQRPTGLHRLLPPGQPSVAQGNRAFQIFRLQDPRRPRQGSLEIF